MENIFPLEIPSPRDVIVAAEDPHRLLSHLPQGFSDFFRRPDKKPAFHPFAVRVLCRVESPLRRGHLPPDIVHRSCGNSLKGLIPRRLIALQIEHNQLGVVIEHLFKVRDEPVVIHRVAVKSPAQMVIDPPLRHLFETQLKLRESRLIPAEPVVAEQER